MYNNPRGFKPLRDMDERRATRDVEFDCKSDMKNFTPWAKISDVISILLHPRLDQLCPFVKANLDKYLSICPGLRPIDCHGPH